jgi:hypothetical protein
MYLCLTTLLYPPNSSFPPSLKPQNTLLYMGLLYTNVTHTPILSYIYLIHKLYSHTHCICTHSKQLSSIPLPHLSLRPSNLKMLFYVWVSYTQTLHTHTHTLLYILYTNFTHTRMVYILIPNNSPLSISLTPLSLHPSNLKMLVYIWVSYPQSLHTHPYFFLYISYTQTLLKHAWYICYSQIVKPGITCND